MYCLDLRKLTWNNKNIWIKFCEFSTIDLQTVPVVTIVIQVLNIRSNLLTSYVINNKKSSTKIGNNLCI